MQPLFDSSDPSPLPPELRWYIPPRDQLVGKPYILVAKPVGLQTHRVGYRTLPCLRQWPKLGVECPHCERSLRFACWVPLIPVGDPEKKQIVMGATNTWNSVKKLEVGTVVECMHVRVIKPTLIFRRHGMQLGARALNDAAEHMHPHLRDITRWLLHYWQWEFLTKLFKQVPRESRKVRTTKERAEDRGFDFLKPSDSKAG